MLLLMTLVACEESYDLYPDTYKQVIAIKGDNSMQVSLNTAQGAVTDSILILKGGGGPYRAASAALRVMTLDETCEQWGYDEDDIALLPEGSYQLDGQVNMGADQHYGYATITFNPSSIYQQLQGQKDRTWLLPLKLVSQTDTVSATKNLLLMQIEVANPDEP